VTLNRDQWEDDNVSPLIIDLDDVNPRLDPQSRKSQSGMLQALIAHEGVIQLAKQINNFSGLFPSKRIIVVRADDRFIVVEGNRRVSACKLLLKPWLAVHTELEQQIPIIDERTRENLNNVPVIVAATRAVADEVVANLHLAGGKREWSDIGQIRYASDRYALGRSVDDIAKDLASSPDEIRKFLAYDKMYNFVLSLNWSDNEKDILWDFRIDIKPLTKILFSNNIKKHFGQEIILFDNRPNFSFPNLDSVLKIIATNCIVSQHHSNVRRFLRDSNIQDYLNEIFPIKDSITERQGDLLEKNQVTLFPQSSYKVIPDSDEAIVTEKNKDNNRNQDGGKNRYHHKAEAFFENLICRQDDERMRQLCKELRNIDENIYLYSARNRGRS
jgi:hypothetical protein